MSLSTLKANKQNIENYRTCKIYYTVFVVTKKRNIISQITYEYVFFVSYYDYYIYIYIYIFNTRHELKN